MTVLWSFEALYWLQLFPYLIADFANGVIEKETGILCNAYQMNLKFALFFVFILYVV